MGKSSSESSSSGGMSTGMVILLILFIIFLILAVVFIWLYVVSNNKVSELQTVIDTNANCPPGKECPPCPKTAYENFAVSWAPEMISCPSGSVIQSVSLNAKLSNGTNRDITGYFQNEINGKTTYTLDPRYLGAGSNAKIIYGSWQCSNGQVPIPPKPTSGGGGGGDGDIYLPEVSESNWRLLESDRSCVEPEKKQRKRYYRRG